MKERIRIGLGVVVGVLLLGVVASVGLAQDFGLPGKGKAAATRPEVVVEARLDRARVVPGGQVAVAVILDHARGWHSWPSAAQKVLPEEIELLAQNTAIDVVGEPDWVGWIGPVQWPEPHDVTNPLGDPPKVKAYEGRAVAFVPLVIDASATAGVRTLRLEVYYQACDATTCLMPETVELELAIEIVGEGKPVESGDSGGGLFEGFDRVVFRGASRGGDAALVGGESEPVGGAPDGGAEGNSLAVGGTSMFFGVSLAFLSGPLGIVLLILFSALGGAILNLTPCVLPVIPIKVMTLTSHASSPGRTMYLGAWMAAGVVSFWVGIGLPAAFIGGVLGEPSRLFGIWWVTFGLGVLISLMALGLMGLFTLTLPQKVYAVNPNADNASGSFLFGVMTGVLGLPCFGFVAGALLGAAAAFPPVVTLAMFAGIGIGMAAPYLVLAAKPSLLRSVPKTGPASDLVKQVMGLLLLAAGAFFVGSGLIALVSANPFLGRQLHWWAVAALAVMAGLWLIIRTFQLTSKPGRRIAFSVLGLAIGGSAAWYAMNSTATARSAYLERERLLAAAGGHEAILTSVWMDFSPELQERARAEGYIVVVDFTAEWCLNCKALKATVLNREPVKSALTADDVVMLTADLTSTSAPGWDFLREELGQTGIPMLAVYGPGLDTPWMSNAYTSGQVVEALGRARRQGVASAPGDGPDHGSVRP